MLAAAKRRQRTTKLLQNLTVIATLVSHSLFNIFLQKHPPITRSFSHCICAICDICFNPELGALQRCF
jgi:hypothetical protein